jgi:hypothetical protein
VTRRYGRFIHNSLIRNTPLVARVADPTEVINMERWFTLPALPMHCSRSQSLAEDPINHTHCGEQTFCSGHMDGTVMEQRTRGWTTM